ncbi:MULTISPECIES: hypothetical protein [unclassified Streptomyces]|uniref:hypothetical protein n=1 Tax=unclassified Streptomyces TaxID=2593676 RepID=UPI003253229D
MLPCHVTENGVLIIHLQADLDIAGRAAAVWSIDGHLAAHRLAPLMLRLSDAPLSTAAVSTVVRTYRMCRTAGTPLSVVAAHAENPPDTGGADRRRRAGRPSFPFPGHHRALGRLGPGGCSRVMPTTQALPVA